MSGQIVKASDARSKVEAALEKNRTKLQAVLPQHIGFERMVIMVTKTMVQVPKLCECDQASLLGAIIQACQLGLEVDNGLGHAYILPYWNNRKKSYDATFIAGYKGLIDLAWRSGKVKSIRAKAVYEGDVFMYEDGLEPVLKHRAIVEPEPNKLTHVYAIIEMVNGGRQHEVMTRKQIETVQSQSRAGGGGPWVSHFEEMAKKTVLRKMLKYAPMSAEIARAVALDEMAVGNIDQAHDATFTAATGQPIEVEAKDVTEERVPEPGAPDQGPDWDGLEGGGQ